MANIDREFFERTCRKRPYYHQVRAVLDLENTSNGTKLNLLRNIIETELHTFPKFTMIKNEEDMQRYNALIAYRDQLLELDTYITDSLLKIYDPKTIHNQGK